LNDDDRRFASLGRALVRVEAGLREELDVAAMAEAACYSLFHFVRVFTELTGHGPYDYLMRRRVAEAAKEVAAGGRSILDIALEYRFESPEGFSRAFKRCFGLSPSEARREGRYPEGSARTPIDEDYARRLRSSGLRARAETAPLMVITGTPRVDGGQYPAGSTVAVVSIASRPAPCEGIPVIAGRVLADGEAEPGIPSVTARIAGGSFLVAAGAATIDVELARDLLYRTAFPISGTGPRGDCEIAILDEAGAVVELRIPAR
jgi:AraC-like DNA-binding protein